MVLQGRRVTSDDLHLVCRLLQEHPTWNRTRLSGELCGIWNWRNEAGRFKDMACRSLLLKLESRGFVRLPARQRPSPNASLRRHAPPVLHSTEPVQCPLRELAPLRVEIAQTAASRVLFRCLLQGYHYLGYTGPVGQNLQYLVFDRRDRPLACLLFGSAAWKVAPRDAWIGWDPRMRRARLALLTNNMRFLILPWVRVPHLASHLLARVAARIRTDWIARYGHPVVLLETFVDASRFRGTCYRAANWVRVGTTTGRTRNDRERRILVPPKDVYLYPLIPQFREVLQGAA